VLGGLDCGWTSDSDAYVWLDVIPSAGLEAQVAHAESDSPHCSGGEPLESRCSFSMVVDGYWFTGIVGVSPGATGSALDVIDVLAANLAATASTNPSVAAVRPDRMWSAPADCAVFGSEIDTPGILGEEYSAAEGNLGGEVSPGFLGALDVVGDTPCVWAGADGTGWFGTELLPGAGWAMTELADREGAAPVAVEGARAALAVPMGGETIAVYATDGVNLGWVTVPADLGEASAGALASAVLAAASR
jgi:hypothetical protein